MGAVLLGIALTWPLTIGVGAQDRAVVWLRAEGGRFERDLNQAAARGLRVAAVTDGLPCGFAVLQTPEQTGAQDEYRVVRDDDVQTQLPALVEAGFIPKWSAAGAGTRHNVIFERGPFPRQAERGARWSSRSAKSSSRRLSRRRLKGIRRA